MAKRGVKPGTVNNPEGVGAFKAGQKGLSKGNKTKYEFRRQKALRLCCIKYGKEIIEYYINVMRDDGQETSDRLTAAKIVLQYGYGQPKQQVDLGDGEGGPAKLIVEIITK